MKTNTVQLEATHYAEVVKNQSIRLFGTTTKSEYAPNYAKTGFDRTDKSMHYTRSFAVGDVATYDSYNLIYTGIITAIGDKTVTIIERHHSQDGASHDGKKHMLKLAVFGWRNRDFDAAKASEHNSNEMNYI